MKNFNATQEVKDRIDALFSELHELCATNHIPYVASCITGNDDTVADQVLSVWLDGEEDLVPMNLAAATELLEMPFIPDELFDFIMEVSDELETDDDIDTECDCPACKLARGAAAGLH